MSFLPVTIEDVASRGWPGLDVIFITGDAYVDHPAFGVPLLARLLESRGFRVGIISQPDWRSREPFAALGRPSLFFAVSAGAMDSMVAHYTSTKRLRSDDAYTPGNRHGARPNRATIVYTTRVKETFKDVPVVLGGIEASLRRFAHYDYWDDRVRRSVLFDSKADLLVYGMGERPLLELAERMRCGEKIDACTDIRGTAYKVSSSRVPMAGTSVLEIPAFEQVASDRRSFAEAFCAVETAINSFSDKVITQRHGDRFLVCNPPALPLAESEIDAVYALPFEKLPHPSYRENIKAWEQIKSSITTHRGCVGGCSFCSIAQHQGKIVQSRSEESIFKEIKQLCALSWFSGTISDIGGPSANMYAMACGKKKFLHCQRSSCLFPDICSSLSISDKRLACLLKGVSRIKGVRHVSVSSGIRFDLFHQQPGYFAELIARHVSGLLKVAPEHFAGHVTCLMGKSSRVSFIDFLQYFRSESLRLGKRQFIVPYMMSGHPGCSLSDMVDTALLLKRLSLKVEQVQDFTPTPGTRSTCMYYTGMDPYTGEDIYVPRGIREKRLQKSLLLYHLAEERNNVLMALRSSGRSSDAVELLERSRGR